MRRAFYLARIEADMHAWEGILESLEERLPQVPDNVRPRLAVELRAARVKYLGVETSIRDLQGTGEEVWETLRPKVEQAWEACKGGLLDLDVAFHRAVPPTVQR